jgi:hypothetical protein
LKRRLARVERGPQPDPDDTRRQQKAAAVLIRIKEATETLLKHGRDALGLPDRAQGLLAEAAAGRAVDDAGEFDLALAAAERLAETLGWQALKALRSWPSGHGLDDGSAG